MQNSYAVIPAGQGALCPRSEVFYVIQLYETLDSACKFRIVALIFRSRHYQ